MPTVSDQAIVIRRWDFSETSQTVSLLTRGHGVVRGLAKGAKREKANFSGGLDLLTEGQIVMIIKPGRDLATLTAWHLQATHRVLHEQLQANRAALYMADLVHHMLIDHDPHPAVFHALSAALALIDQQPDRSDIALLRLQWAVLTEAGYQPDLASETETANAGCERNATVLFSARAGGVVRATSAPPSPPASAGGEQTPVAAASTSSSGMSGWRVRRETIDLLRDLARGSDISTHDAESLRRANRLLAAYCREIIGNEPAAMRWAFPDLAASLKGS